MNRPKVVAAVIAAIMVASCGNETPPADDASQIPDTSHEGMSGMSMPGADGANQAMRQHMLMMEGASADSLRAMMPAHRQMAGNMLAQMNQQMTSMNMQADAAWTAAVDSIRADLTRMPDLSAADLRALMPGHAGRLSRLMDMHDTMMKNMRM